MDGWLAVRAGSSVCWLCCSCERRASRSQSISSADNVKVVRYVFTWPGIVAFIRDSRSFSVTIHRSSRSTLGSWVWKCQESPSNRSPGILVSVECWASIRPSIRTSVRSPHSVPRSVGNEITRSSPGAKCSSAWFVRQTTLPLSRSHKRSSSLRRSLQLIRTVTARSDQFSNHAKCIPSRYRSTMMTSSRLPAVTSKDRLSCLYNIVRRREQTFSKHSSSAFRSFPEAAASS